MQMILDTLIGKKVTLVAYSDEIEAEYDEHGYTERVRCTFLKFKYDNKPYIMLIREGSNDGYRSSFGSTDFVDESHEDLKQAKFYKLPPAKVKLIHEVRNCEDSYGYGHQTNEYYEFIDDVGSVWFSFGTLNVDDYYPSYFCGAHDIDKKAYRELNISDLLDD